MSPILTGIVASGISGHLTPAWSPQGAYDALASVTLSTAASTISFSGIPQDYKHLQLRLSAYSTANDCNGLEYYNDADGSPYTRHAFYAGASSPGAFSQVSTSAAQSIDYFNYSTAPSVRISDYLDYSSDSKYKTIRHFWGREYNSTTSVVGMQTTLWSSLDGIQKINLSLSGGSYAAGTKVSLYGVR